MTSRLLEDARAAAPVHHAALPRRGEADRAAAALRGRGAPRSWLRAGSARQAAFAQAGARRRRRCARSGAGSPGHGDALATARRGLPLAISTADCLPIVLYDARGGRLAAVHAGWRGTVQSVARAAVADLVAAGSAAGDLVVAIGPSIGPCCYEVDAPVIERFEAAFPGAWEAWMTPKGPGKWMLDLWQANLDQLTGAGVRPGPGRQPGPLHRVPPGPALLLSPRARRRPPGHGGGAARAGVLESPPLMLDIRANLGRVQEAVARACARSGRSPDHVLLIAVSKTMDVERVRMAVAAGVAALGENRVQEARDKIEALGRPVPWHLIGGLQTNKARDAARLFDWIHSVDRLELARELSRRAHAAGRTVNVLLAGQPRRRAAEGRAWRPRRRSACCDAVARPAAPARARPDGDPARRRRRRRRRGRTSARCASCATAWGSSTCPWA